MSIRTIIAAISGGSASFGAADLACELAARFKAHVEGFRAEIDPRLMITVGVDDVGSPQALHAVDKAAESEAEATLRAQSVFNSAVKRYQMSICDTPPTDKEALLQKPSATWRVEIGRGTENLVSRARMFDLVVLGRSGRVVGEPHSDAIEAALLAAGRPVLIAPEKKPEAIGKSVALAWNDSAQSASALAAALPFLTTAREVHLLALGDTKAKMLADHLGWYGIKAEVHSVYKVERAGAGDLLLAAAREHGADLLAMGGYGHAPWREMLFGGATRHIIGVSRLPLLLAH